MSDKYSVMARNYNDKMWEVALYTNNKIKAVKVWIKALFKYELVEFVVRKEWKPSEIFYV